jgi:hypothetical protein
MNANKTTKGWEASNHRGRKDKQTVALIRLHKIKLLNNKNNEMAGIITYLSMLTLLTFSVNIRLPYQKTLFGKLD